MISTKKAISIITEFDEDKRNAAIDKLSEADAKQLVKAFAKAARERMGDPWKELGLE